MFERAPAKAGLFAACLLGGLAAASPSHADQAQDDLVARGKYLTTAADCGPCHSGPAHAAFSGGYASKLPGLGTLVSPNITPDNDTGIGKMTADQFYRVLHEGIGLQGEYLYPVMPFPWYTKITRADSDAIYAYMRTIPPVHAPNMPNDLVFPFNIREGMLAWRTAFFHEGAFKPDPSRSEQLNRGAYLVTALGHCSECHGNALFGSSQFAGPLTGGVIDNWYAPNITSDDKQGIGSWSEDELAQFLKVGAVPGKTVAVGPMREVVHSSLSLMSDSDLHAIAAYLKSTKPEEKYESSKPQAFAGNDGPGVEVYLNHCAACHMRNGEGVSGEVPPLKGNGAVIAQGPETVIHVVLQGVIARGDYRMMPALGADMTDQQIADVTNYVRHSWGNNTSSETAGGGSVAKIRADSFIALSDKSPTCYPPGEPPTPDPTLQALDDSKNGVVALMQKLTPDNLINQTGVVVDKARALVPHAAKADLVNQLYHAYCPVVASQPGMSLTQKRWQLTNFTQLVYAQLTHPEKTVQNGQ